MTSCDRSCLRAYIHCLFQPLQHLLTELQIIIHLVITLKNRKKKIINQLLVSTGIHVLEENRNASLLLCNETTQDVMVIKYQLYDNLEWILMQ